MARRLFNPVHTHSEAVAHWISGQHAVTSSASLTRLFLSSAPYQDSYLITSQGLPILVFTPTTTILTLNSLFCTIGHQQGVTLHTTDFDIDLYSLHRASSTPDSPLFPTLYLVTKILERLNFRISSTPLSDYLAQDPDDAPTFRNSNPATTIQYLEGELQHLLSVLDMSREELTGEPLGHVFWLSDPGAAISASSIRPNVGGLSTPRPPSCIPILGPITIPMAIPTPPNSTNTLGPELRPVLTIHPANTLTLNVQNRIGPDPLPETDSDSELESQPEATPPTVSLPHPATS